MHKGWGLTMGGVEENSPHTTQTKVLYPEISILVEEPSLNHHPWSKQGMQFHAEIK
jgi:hypothetical protein